MLSEMVDGIQHSLHDKLMHEVHAVTDELLEIPGIIEQFRTDFDDFKDLICEISKASGDKQTKFTIKMEEKFE